MSEQTMWAATRDGKLVYWSVDLMRSSVIERLLQAYPHDTWKSLRRHGFRCVRVRITEAQDGQ